MLKIILLLFKLTESYFYSFLLPVDICYLSSHFSNRAGVWICQSQWLKSWRLSATYCVGSYSHYPFLCVPDSAVFSVFEETQNKDDCLRERLYLLLPGVSSVQFSSVQLLSRVQLFATPWTAACLASLSITNSWSSPKLMSIELVMPSSHLILCCPLLLLPAIPPSTRVFSNESTLRMRWPKYWNFSSSISPYKEIPGLISFRMDWLDLLQSKGLSRVFSNTTVQKHQFFGAQPSSQSNSHIHTWLLEKP